MDKALEQMDAEMAKAGDRYGFEKVVSKQALAQYAHNEMRVFESNRASKKASKQAN